MDKRIVDRTTFDNNETCKMLRIVCFSTGLLSIIFSVLIQRTYTDGSAILNGLVFAGIYFTILIMTYISNYIKKKPEEALYAVYFISSLAMIYGIYAMNFSVSGTMIFVFGTLIVSFRIKKISYLNMYFTTMLLSIIFVSFAVKNPGVDRLSTIAICFTFFMLSYLDLKSKIITESALEESERHYRKYVGG